MSCDISKENFATQVNDLVDYIISQKKIEKKEQMQIIFNLQQAIVYLFRFNKHCLKDVLELYSAGQPRPFRDAWTEFNHQLRSSGSLPKVANNIAGEIILNQLNQRRGIEFRNRFGNLFGTNFPIKRRKKTTKSKPRSKTLHSLPIEIQTNIINTKRTIAHKILVNDCTDTLRQIVTIFRSPGIPVVNLFPRFRDQILNGPHGQRLQILINKIYSDENCKRVLRLFPKFVNTMTNFDNGPKQTPEYLLFNIYRQFRTPFVNLENQVNQFGNSFPKKQRSLTLNQRVNTLLPETGKEIVGRRLIKLSKTDPCVKLLHELVLIFRHRYNEFCPTETTFNHYYGPHRNDIHYHRLMNLITRIVLNSECINILYQSFPKFRIAWDQFNANGDNNLRHLLWLLYQQFGPHQPHAWENAFDDF